MYPEGELANVDAQGPQVLPLSGQSLELLKAILVDAIGGRRDGSNETCVIVEALPRIVRAARLSITWSTEYLPPAGGGLTFRSVTFDLSEEASFSVAETHYFPQSGSDTAARIIFECRPDGYAEGDLNEWIDLAEDLYDPAVAIMVDLPDMALKELTPESEHNGSADIEFDWAPEGEEAFDARLLSIEAQRRYGLLPPVAEIPQEKVSSSRPSFRQR